MWRAENTPVMPCAICPNPLDLLKRPFDRIFCSKKCKNKSRSLAMAAQYKAWRSAGLVLASTSPELELLLRAPIGAAYYFLTHVASNGSHQRHPSTGGWRLRLFQSPQVLLPGIYAVTFTDVKHLNPIQKGSVPIGSLFVRKKRR